MPRYLNTGCPKFIHCEFCKEPPAKPISEKMVRSMLERKTNLKFGHQAAQVNIKDVTLQPGEPLPDSTACLCHYAGEEEPCPKCAPDPKHPKPKKFVCNCPPGATPYVKPRKPKKKPPPCL